MSKHLCHHCCPLWTTMFSTLIPKVLYICVIKRISLKGIKKLHPKESTWETTQLWKLLAWEMLKLACQ
jgi:hypothetical protein